MEALLTLFNNQIAAHRAQLAVYHKIDIPGLDMAAFEMARLNRDLILRGLTLEFGIRNELMCLEWLEICVKFVQDKTINLSALKLYDSAHKES